VLFVVVAGGGGLGAADAGCATGAGALVAVVVGAGLLVGAVVACRVLADL
jgi:hypothetical protein